MCRAVCTVQWKIGDSNPSCEQSFHNLVGEKGSKNLARAGKPQEEFLYRECVRPEERERGCKETLLGESGVSVVMPNCPRMGKWANFRLPWPLCVYSILAFVIFIYIFIIFIVMNIYV